jgi:uncharacterized protein YggE
MTQKYQTTTTLLAIGLLLVPIIIFVSPVHARNLVKEPAIPASQTTSPDTPLRTITVSGTGNVNLVPDLAYVNIGVHNQNSDVAKAIEENNAQTNKVKDVLMKNGVSEKDIQTSNFSVYTNQQYDNSGAPLEMSYSVDNTLNITVRELSKLGKLIGETTRSGANNIYGIQFDVADKNKGLSEARKLAYEDARNQASEMAGILGVQLGNVQEAKIMIGNAPQPMGYVMGGAGNPEAAKSNVPISAGQLVITVNIDMVYAIK